MGKRQERHPSIAEQYAQWCVHYTGTIQPACKAGVNYRAHVGGETYGWGARLPCILSHTGDGVVPCAQRRFPTSEECAEHQRQHEEALSRRFKAYEAVAPFRKTHRGQRFDTPCPVCGGTLHGSIAQLNGHAHVRCSTAGCVAWME